MDPQQIVIGGAFYGRSWSGVNSDRNGLHQPFNGNRSSHSYTSILELLQEDENYRRHWDISAMAPYIYNPVDSIFITYDDPESLTAKTRYVQEHNLGGIMFWQLSHDTNDHELVNAIYEGMR